jgi:hypothetical protein
LGLHLAEQANPREAGLLFYVASAAEDIGDALALLARYCRISNEAVRVKLTRSPEGVTAEAKYVGLPRQFAWHNTEFLIAILVKGLRKMAGRDFSASACHIHSSASLGTAGVRTLLWLSG